MLLRALPLASLSLLVVASGCDKKPPRKTSTAPGASATASAPAAKHWRACPLSIEPGVALGPVRIGQSRAELDRLGLPTRSVSSSKRSEIVKVGPFRASLCGGKVVDTWLEDLRKAPDCVKVAGKKVDRHLARDDFIKLFHDCKPTPPRSGGEFRECENGGIRIGFGMGDFIQVRVGKTGTHLDDSCDMLLDDGKAVELPAETRTKLLQKTLDLDLLAKFWHPDVSGRDPLHVIDNSITSAHPALTMFGSPVVYVALAEAQKKKLAYFEFEKLEASATKTTITFRFPVEGVAGNVVFRKRLDEWQLESKNVGER